MTPELARTLALFRPSYKIEARFERLTAADNPINAAAGSSAL
jgi:hypothetical protein